MVYGVVPLHLEADARQTGGPPSSGDTAAESGCPLLTNVTSGSIFHFIAAQKSRIAQLSNRENFYVRSRKNPSFFLHKMGMAYICFGMAHIIRNGQGQEPVEREMRELFLLILEKVPTKLEKVAAESRKLVLKRFDFLQFQFF